MGKIKFDLHNLVIAFFYIPCVVPAALLDEESPVKVFFNVWRMIAFLLLFIYIVIQRWYSPTLIFTVLFSLTLIFSTYRSNGAMSSVLSIALMMFTIVTLSELECKKSIKKFLTVIAKINIAILLIDDVQVLMLTGIGSEDNIHTWLGLDNFAVFTVLPMVGTILLSELLNYNKIRKLIFLFCVVTALCKFVTFAVTSMLAFNFIAFYIFSKEYIRVTKNTKKIIILLNVVVAFIILMNFSDIYYFISDITGKSTKYDYSRMIIISWTKINKGSFSKVPWTMKSSGKTQKKERTVRAIKKTTKRI